MTSRSKPNLVPDGATASRDLGTMTRERYSSGLVGEQHFGSAAVFRVYFDAR